MPNEDIRSYMKQRGIYYYRVAQEMHISEATVYRWFREPLKGHRRERVIKAIRAIVERQSELVL